MLACQLARSKLYGCHGLRLLELPTLPTSLWALVSYVESLVILESLAHYCKALVELVDRSAGPAREGTPVQHTVYLLYEIDL